MADIVTLTTIDFARFIGVGVPADLRQLNGWLGRVSARPSAGA
jgi:glutathione S-transferase